MTALPCPPFSRLDARLARAYVAAVLRAAYRRPPLPLDYTTPPRGRCCIAPPAMTEAP